MHKQSKLVIISRLILGILLLFFLMTYIYTISHTLYDIKHYYYIHLTWLKTIKFIFYPTYLIIPSMLVLAVIGFFVKNSLGWVFITQLLYFKLFQILFIEILNNITDYLLLFIPILFIVFMNIKPLRVYYLRTTNNVFTLNLVAIFTSLSLVLLHGYLTINHHMHLMDIIDKL